MSLFRCAGDIMFDNIEPLPGQICNVRLKKFSETCNFLQHLSPLTPEHPYFFAQIRSLTPKSHITLGIAGPDIAENCHPGHWINSVGYHSNSGQCYSSHRCTANTDGEKFGIGDVFGVLVTYFGDTSSTVIFLKNGNPVATRYLFESDHTRYLPTISLEHGPIDLGLMWPEAAIGIPQYSEKNMLHWIKSPKVVFDMERNMFSYDGHKSEVNIQSPHPLSTEIQHFEVVIEEVSEEGAGPAIALATCSPLSPMATSTLLRDFLRFSPDGNGNAVSVGQRIGWGVHYHKAARSRAGFDPKAQQLVLCYLTLDTSFVYKEVMLQPAGGFFPLVILRHFAKKVRVDLETNPRPKGWVSFLDEVFDRLYNQRLKQLTEDKLARKVEQNMFRRSESVEVSMVESVCRIRLPRAVKGIHVVQFLRPLTPDNNYFTCQMRQLDEDSTISIGVAGRDFPLNKHPGKVRPSVGWHSRLAQLVRNDRSDGNLAGHRICRGDLIGVEMEAYATEMSVALFSRNYRPVGTCYYTQREREEFLPSIGLCGNGQEIVIDVCWQNMNGGSPVYSVTDAEQWCMPPGSKVNKESNIIRVPDHIGAAAIQAPYSLSKGYNHFEIRLIDEFSAEQHPPAVVLSTATPLDPPPVTNFKLDFLRFWAINEASKSVRKGDLVGWGVLYVEEGVHHDEEQLVICYLTVNRKVLLVRVLFQPPGGFYPLVILPPGVNRVQLEFGATVIHEHPITEEDVRTLVEDARIMIAEEKEAIAQGIDPHEVKFDSARLFRPLPSAERAGGDSKASQSKVKDTRVGQSAKPNKMATVVTDLVKPEEMKKKLKKMKDSKASLSPSDQNESRSCAVL